MQLQPQFPVVTNDYGLIMNNNILDNLQNKIRKLENLRLIRTNQTQ